MDGGLRFSSPHHQAADGTAIVEQIEQPAQWVTVPHVPPLELGQGHLAAVDVVKDGGDVHGSAKTEPWSRKNASAIGPSQKRLTL